MKVNDYQKKRVNKIEGYGIPNSPEKGYYTIQVMGVDGCVTEFRDIAHNQMCLLWQSFDQASNVEQYVIVGG